MKCFLSCETRREQRGLVGWHGNEGEARVSWAADWLVTCEGTVLEEDAREISNLYEGFAKCCFIKEHRMRGDDRNKRLVHV
jgi:hypothetical protein